MSDHCREEVVVEIYQMPKIKPLNNDMINEKLTERVRQCLSHLKNVEEKKMFSGITFMVNRKMCISVGDDRLMCRIDPALHDELIKSKDVSPVIMKKRSYIGYVYVKEHAVKTQKQLEKWITLCLKFNKKAKASKS